MCACSLRESLRKFKLICNTGVRGVHLHADRLPNVPTERGAVQAKAFGEHGLRCDLNGRILMFIATKVIKSSVRCDAIRQISYCFKADPSLSLRGPRSCFTFQLVLLYSNNCSYHHFWSLCSPITYAHAYKYSTLDLPLSSIPSTRIVHSSSLVDDFVDRSISSSPTSANDRPSIEKHLAALSDPILRTVHHVLLQSQ